MAPEIGAIFLARVLDRVQLPFPAPTILGSAPVNGNCRLLCALVAGVDAPQPTAKRPAPLASILEENIMTSKHPKQPKPSDADLYRNPMIGGSKGTGMAQVTPDELEEFEGVNTIEGDVENDTNPAGGLDKAEVLNRRRGPPDKGREPPPRAGTGSHLSKRQAKGAGSGAMTDLQADLIGENDVLSNRDKAIESGDRGLDSKWVQTEQLEDHAANKGRG
jgi:hypothetical protein